MPVDDSVAAIFWQMMPDLPIPVTTTRPRQPTSSSDRAIEALVEALDQGGDRPRFDLEHAARGVAGHPTPLRAAILPSRSPRRRARSARAAARLSAGARQAGSPRVRRPGGPCERRAADPVDLPRVALARQMERVARGSAVRGRPFHVDRHAILARRSPRSRPRAGPRRGRARRAHRADPQRRRRSGARRTGRRPGAMRRRSPVRPRTSASPERSGCSPPTREATGSPARSRGSRSRRPRRSAACAPHRSMARMPSSSAGNASSGIWLGPSHSACVGIVVHLEEQRVDADRDGGPRQRRR